MRLRLSSLAPLAALPLAIAAISGCGGSSSSSDNGVASKSAADIITATKAAADSASSAHVAGSISSGGSSITIDMTLASGKGGRGQISEGGRSFELIVTGGIVYLKGGDAFYRQLGGEAAVQLFHGKWLKAPTSGSEFAALSSLTELGKLIDSTLASHGTLSKSGTSTVNGQKVVGVTDTSKGGTLYVATTGKPYPVAITKGGSSGGKVSFDQWNEPVTITAPTNAVDITQLQHASH